MKSTDLTSSVMDGAVRKRNLESLRNAGVVLPKFSELADAASIPQSIRGELAAVDPDSRIR